MKSHVKVYTVADVLDTRTCTQEQSNILALIESPSHIILDLSRCAYVSSAGLRVILYAYKIAQAKGCEISLAGVCKNVCEVMQMTGFNKFFSFYDTVEECINS